MQKSTMYTQGMLGWLATALFVVVFLVDYATVTPLLHEEAYGYARYYGTPASDGLRGEIAKLFDVCQVDSCLPRFRPGGYLLELVDAQAMKWFGGILGFHSLVHLLSVLLLIPVLASIARRLAPDAPRATHWALGAFFSASSQVLMLNALYFRPGKIFAAFVCAYAIDSWLRYRDTSVRATPLAPMLLLMLGTFFDEQVTVVCTILAGAAVMDGMKPRRLLAPAVFLSVPVFFYAVSALWIGPMIMQVFASGPLVADYTRATEFMRFDMSHLRESLMAVIVQYATLFGPAWMHAGWSIAGIMLVLIAITGVRGSSAVQPFVSSRELYIVIASWLMIYVLSLRHPPILAAEGKRVGYYYVVFAVLLYVGALMFCAARGVLSHPVKRARLLAALMLAAIVHAGTIGSARSRMWQTGYAGYAGENRDIRSAIQGDRAVYERLRVPARGFVDYYVREVVRK